MVKKSILFVCTGNIFRSLSAEFAFRKYLLENGILNWEVGSAGITAKKELIDPKTVDVLRKMGIRNTRHKQKKATKSLLNRFSVVVAMAENHYNFIKHKTYYNHVFLFNELAINKKTSIMDVEEEIKDYK